MPSPSHHGQTHCHRPHRKPPDQASLSLAIATNAKLLVFFVDHGGSSSLSSRLVFFFFFSFHCDRCLKELGMAFCYWFYLILGWIFFVGSWWWSWGLPWFDLILILILWVAMVAGVCGWGFKKTTVWICSSWWWW